MNLSLEMARFSAFWAVFLSVFSPEKCWIFRLQWDLLDVEDILLENSEYSVRVMGLINFLLYYGIECKQSGAWNFETWQNKGTMSISVPSVQIMGDSSPCPHDLCPR